MKLLSILLALFTLLALATATPIISPNIPQAHNLLLVDKITIFSGATGNVTENSGNINGNLLGYQFVNGNFTGVGEIYLNQTWPYDQNLDYYNVSKGNYSEISYYGEGGYGSYPIVGKIAAHMYQAQANRTATVYLFYR